MPCINGPNADLPGSHVKRENPHGKLVAIVGKNLQFKCCVNASSWPEHTYTHTHFLLHVNACNRQKLRGGGRKIQRARTVVSVEHTWMDAWLAIDYSRSGPCALKLDIPKQQERTDSEQKLSNKLQVVFQMRNDCVHGDRMAEVGTSHGSVEE